MRFESKAEVVVPAHKIGPFRASISRHAPSEHGFRSVEFSHVSVRKVDTAPGGHVVAQVLIDCTGQDSSIEDAGEAAHDTIVWSLIKLGAETHIDVTTRTVG